MIRTPSVAQQALNDDCSREKNADEREKGERERVNDIGRKRGKTEDARNEIRMRRKREFEACAHVYQEFLLLGF